MSDHTLAVNSITGSFNTQQYLGCRCCYVCLALARMSDKAWGTHRLDHVWR